MVGIREKIVFEKFSEWTGNSDPEKARIAIFEHIRDIPYALTPDLRDPHTGPAGMLAQNRGSCSPKHYLLGFMFGELGIPVKYPSYKFSWNVPQIKYPEDLRKLAEQIPLGYHVACKAYINGRWILVDATWDLSLRKVGFPVNESWDGISDTRNAVIPLEEILHETPEERADYSRVRREECTEKEKAVYAEFIEKFNTWVERVRSDRL